MPHDERVRFHWIRGMLCDPEMIEQINYFVRKATGKIKKFLMKWDVVNDGGSEVVGKRKDSKTQLNERPRVTFQSHFWMMRSWDVTRALYWSFIYRHSLVSLISLFSSFRRGQSIISSKTLERHSNLLDRRYHVDQSQGENGTTRQTITAWHTVSKTLTGKEVRPPQLQDRTRSDCWIDLFSLDRTWHRSRGQGRYHHSYFMFVDGLILV